MLFVQPQDFYFLHILTRFPRFSPVLDIFVLYQGVQDDLVHDARTSILTSFGFKHLDVNLLDRSLQLIISCSQNLAILAVKLIK